MTVYLRRRHPTLAPHLLLILSASYALCGFSLAYQSNTMWFDALILLPLTLYGLEDLIRHRTPFLFIATLALILLTNYYMGYMTVAFCILLFLRTCLFSSSDKKQKFTNNATIFILSSLLAMILSSVILIPAAHSLTFGKTDFISPTQRESILITPFDLLRKSLPATYDSLLDDAAPFLYCGSFTLLLLPYYFLSKNISKRQKIGNALLLAILAVSMIAEPLDRVWHGFSAPNGLPFRYAFFLVFLLLTMAADTLCLPIDQALSLRQRLLPLGVTTAALTMCIPLLHRYEPSLQESPYFVPIALCGVLLSAISLIPHFLLFGNIGFKRGAATLLSIIVLTELVCNGVATQNAIHEDVTYTSQSVFDTNSAAHTAVAEQLKLADGGFYRAETTAHLKSNDNFLSELHGVSGSTSTLHADSIRLLSDLGIPARWHRSEYISPNPVTDSLLGIRYVISSDSTPFYTPILTESGLTAYQNPQSLSLAYAIERTDTPEFGNNPAKNCNLLLKHLLGEDTQDVFAPIPTDLTLFGGCKAYPSDEDTTVYLPNGEDATAFVTLTAIPTQTGDVFFTFPSPITSPVYLSVNEKSFGVQFDSAASYLLYLGRFEAGEQIKVRMVTAQKDRPLQPYRNEPHFYYYNEVTAQNALSALGTTQLTLDPQSTDTRLMGTVTTKKAETTLLFTVPYDRNWQIYVDGRRVETQKALGALIAFRVDDADTHRVELRYRSPQLIVGALCSICGVLLTCGAFYLERKKHFLSKLP